MSLLQSFYPVKRSSRPPKPVKIDVPTISMGDLLSLRPSAPPPGYNSVPPSRRSIPAQSNVVAGARLEKELRRTEKMVTWQAHDAKKKLVAVHFLPDDATAAEVEAFAENVKRLAKLTREEEVAGLAGVLSMTDDHRAFVSSRCEIGTARDLPALGWDLEKIVRFFRDIVHTVEELHVRGNFLGCILPDDIWVDDDFEPVVAWTGSPTVDPARMAEGDRDFVPPEIKSGDMSDGRSDVFVLGRILESLGTEWLKSADEAGVRAIRRVVTNATAKRATRTESIGRLLEDAETAVELVATLDAERAAKGAKGVARAVPRVVVAAAPRVRKPMPTFVGIEETFVEFRPFRQSWFVAGVVGLASMVLVAYLSRLGHRPFVAVSWAGALAAGLAAASMPVNAKYALFGRGTYAAAAILLISLLDPFQTALELGKNHRLHSTNHDSVATEMNRELGSRHPKLGGLDLHEMNLSGRNLAETSLQDTNLHGANLQGTNLTGVDFGGADVGEASLEGAILDAAALDQAKGLDSAVCNDATRMPPAWDCQDGRFVRRVTKSLPIEYLR